MVGAGGRGLSRFDAEMAVPLGDRVARLELQRRSPDDNLAARGFIAGRNHPDDVPGMMAIPAVSTHRDPCSTDRRLDPR